MFELVQKDDGTGRSKRTLFKSDSLGDIAKVSAEKSGEDIEELFDFGDPGGGD